jgi:hypothetical protein
MPPKLGAGQFCHASAVVVDQAPSLFTLHMQRWLLLRGLRILLLQAAILIRVGILLLLPLFSQTCPRHLFPQPMGGFGHTAGIRLQGEHKL